MGDSKAVVTPGVERAEISEDELERELSPVEPARMGSYGFPALSSSCELQPDSSSPRAHAGRSRRWRRR